MIYIFHADYCVPCKRMENEGIFEYLKKEYKAIDVDMDTDEGIDTARYYSVLGLPTIVIADNEGRFIASLSDYHNLDEVKDFIDENIQNR